ncbi:N-acetylmuramoyl-L-alanine amidase [Vagococcus fessus]|uniref:SH3b domain-containing protein n=1 Tax=Vagococcus fessus TaxID=120370 RepID=A0A430A4H1_9ENTE|nr:N-acetylmuramoyl-L-alanine amidase [Vagococcus fessus]RSU01628.1 hypothetical protein CBF31_10395 [Vagococcus fessus]
MKAKKKQWKIYLLFLLATAILTVSFVVTIRLAIADLNPKRDVVITGNKAVIRMEPDLNSTKITNKKMGDTVKITNRKKDWYRVKVGKKKYGWLPVTETNRGQINHSTNIKALAKKDKVKIKLKPDTDSLTVGTLSEKEAITITAQLAEWSQISTEKVEGWVLTSSLRQLSKPDKNETVSTNVYVRQKTTSLYSEPKESSKVVSKLFYNDELIYLSRQNGWYKVLTNKDKIGYIPNWVVNFTKPNKKHPYLINPIIGKTIMLDPGHGGDDAGALSNDEIVYEKTVTLASARYVKKALEKKGAHVILTRTNDTTLPLDDITKKENSLDVDVFISFHYDSTEYSNQASGFTTYYYNPNDQLLAQSVSDELGKELPLPNRGTEFGDYMVIRESTTSALLLELGYMNNDFDKEHFIKKSYQKKVAKAVADGLYNYFENH